MSARRYRQRETFFRVQSHHRYVRKSHHMHVMCAFHGSEGGAGVLPSARACLALHVWGRGLRD